MTRRLVVATANVDQTAGPPLARLLGTPAGKPDIIVLTEAKVALTHVTAFASRWGYDLRGGAADVLVLARDLAHVQPIRMNAEWYWRNGRRAPRVHLAFHADGVPAFGVHQVPGGPDGAVPVTGGKNKAAWHEGADHQRQALRDGRLVIGDLNAHRHELIEHITSRVPGATIAMTGDVDGVLIPAGWRHISTQTTKGPGHGWGCLTLQEAS